MVDSISKSAITGYVSLQENLIYYKKFNIIVKADFEHMKPDTVRIISDQPWPINMGYVGEGMATASSDDTLKTILMTTPPKGSVLVFTDNPLHAFAAETARIRYGYNVECIQNVKHSIECIVLQKLAGAMSARTFGLKEIKKYCNKLRRVSVPIVEDDIEMSKILDILPSAYDHQHKPKIIAIFNAVSMSSCNQLLKNLRSEYDIGLIMQGNFTDSPASVTVFDYDEPNIIDFLKFPVRISAAVPFNNVREFGPAPDHPIIHYDPDYLVDPNSYQQECYLVKSKVLDVETTRKVFDCVITVIQKCEKILADNGNALLESTRILQKAVNNEKINIEYPCIMLQQLGYLLHDNKLRNDFCVHLAIALQGAAEAFILVEDNDDAADDDDVVPHFQLWFLASRFALKALEKYGRSIVTEGIRCGVEYFETAIGTSPSIRETVDEFANGCETRAEDGNTDLKSLAIIARSIADSTKSVLHKHGID